MFPDNICQNIDILVVINVQKNNFGFHSNQKTQGQKHQVNNLYFKYQVYQMKLRHLNTFLQFRLLFHEPHCWQIFRRVLSSSRPPPPVGGERIDSTGLEMGKISNEENKSHSTLHTPANLSPLFLIQ